jgi:hypothetical protein
VKAQRGQIDRARLREAGLEVLALPAAVFLALALADVARGRGASPHFLQLAPFALLLALAWRFPHAIGVALVMVSAAATIAFYATIAAPPLPAIVAGTVAFVPPLIAGALLLLATRRA